MREGGDGKPSRVIEGYAIMFDVPSVPLYQDDTEEIREVISRAAITRELLDKSDIKMTLFHDRQLILARSKQGAGTLSYDIDEQGVSFSFEAPMTVDGDKAVELVRRGDITGCSFAFTADYSNRAKVTRETVRNDAGQSVTTFTVMQIDGVYDFTLAADPAYEQTSCALREMIEREHATIDEVAAKSREQISEMRMITGIF